MDKQLFDEAIGEVPPSTVDVGAAIARGRRAAWVQRAAVTGGVVAGVAAMTLGVSVVMTPDRTGQVGTAGPTMPESMSEQPAAPPPCGEGETPTVPIGAERAMAELLREKVSEQLAAGQVEDVDAEHRQFVPTEKPSCAQVKRSIMAFHDYLNIVVKVSSANSDVSLDIARLGGWNYLDTTAQRKECTNSEGPNGELVISCAWQPADNEYSVQVVRSDGTGLVLSSYGYDGGQPPLDLDQLRKIALDPELTLNR